MSLHRIGAHWHGLTSSRSVIRDLPPAAGSAFSLSLLLRPSRLPQVRFLHHSPRSLLDTDTFPSATSLPSLPQLCRRHISTQTQHISTNMAELLNNRAASSLERIADSQERPALDDRTYRVVRLPNQLEALLIHDPETDKASGALDVNVGSFSDKDDMPGLAHAVEHMLFMGTEKV